MIWKLSEGHCHQQQKLLEEWWMMNKALLPLKLWYCDRNFTMWGIKCCFDGLTKTDKLVDDEVDEKKGQTIFMSKLIINCFLGAPLSRLEAFDMGGIKAVKDLFSLDPEVLLNQDKNRLSFLSGKCWKRAQPLRKTSSRHISRLLHVCWRTTNIYRRSTSRRIYWIRISQYISPTMLTDAGFSFWSNS